jgi:preprotein translocase SecE subunit
MARITTRRPEEDEEDLIEDIEEEEEQQVAAAPVSDRRRRRKLKRGESVMEEADEEDSAALQPARKDRPTPSQRVETIRSRNPIIRLYQSAVEYFRDVVSELRKVTWLSREDTLRLTYIVIAVTAASAAFLGLVSFLFGLLTQAMATSSSAIIAGIITMAIIIGVGGAWLLRERIFGGHFE